MANAFGFDGNVSDAERGVEVDVAGGPLRSVLLGAPGWC